jgi:toxin ParE1/3/4
VTWTIRLDHAAEAELAEIARWYDDRRPGLGRAFVEAVDDILAVVAETPLAFVAVERADPRLGIRQAPMARFPYLIVYLVSKEEVRVIAFAHQRRDPGPR